MYKKKFVWLYLKTVETVLFVRNKWFFTITAPRELLAPVVSSIEARQITVTWSPPTISGGLLTKYQIQAMPILARSPIPKIADLTDISLKTYNLTSLDPYTTYNVSVKAYTVGGSIESGHVRIVTLEASKTAYISKDLTVIRSSWSPRKKFPVWTVPEKVPWSHFECFKRRSLAWMLIWIHI